MQHFILSPWYNNGTYIRGTFARAIRAQRVRASRECRVRVCLRVCVFLRVHIYTYRPNIILTPDVRRTVKTSKMEARGFVSRFSHFRSRIRLLRVPRRKSTVTSNNLEYITLGALGEARGWRDRGESRVRSKTIEIIFVSKAHSRNHAINFWAKRYTTKPTTI